MSVFSTKAEKVFILAFFFIALGVPLFFNENTFYVNKISTMLILSIFVMSLDYLVGKTGLISLGHAMFYGLGGYLFAIMVPEYEEVNFWILFKSKSLKSIRSNTFSHTCTLTPL